MARLMKVLLVAASLLLPALAVSVNPGITYTSPTGTTNIYTGVGIPFQVLKPFYFEDLGVYDFYDDFEKNGIQGSTQITVSVRPWSGSLTDFAWYFASPAASVTLTSSSPAAYGSVWQPLSTPVTLSPGWYILWATGFDALNPSIDNPSYNLNTFGGALSYGFNQGGSYYQFVDLAWKTGSSPIFIAGGSLSVPEPSAYALMASVGLALYLLRRRRARTASH